MNILLSSQKCLFRGQSWKNCCVSSSLQIRYMTSDFSLLTEAENLCAVLANYCFIFFKGQIKEINNLSDVGGT